MSSGWALPAVSAREWVLLATAEIWSERGYDGLSTEAICSRAKIDAAAFEAMFADVEAAAEATHEVPLSAVVRIVAGSFSPDCSEAESYAAAIVGILELMAANPAYTFVSFIGGRQNAPAGVQSVYESGHRFLVALLERLWEASGLKDQPGNAALAALGGAEAVVRRELLAGRHQRLPSLAPDFVYIATVPFLGQERALRLARSAPSLLRERRR